MIKRLTTIALAAGLFFVAGEMSAQHGCCSKKAEGTSCSKKQEQKQEQTNTPSPSIGEVNKLDVQKMIQAGGVMIFDARSQSQFEAGHIEGASLFTPALLPVDKSTPLLFYCGSVRCPASHKAAKKAIELGYTRVMVYTEGWAGWSSNS